MEPLTRVRRLSRKRVTTEQEWRASLREAVAHGYSLRQVAEAAEVSHVRVLQIVRGK